MESINSSTHGYHKPPHQRHFIISPITYIGHTNSFARWWKLPRCGIAHDIFRDVTFIMLLCIIILIIGPTLVTLDFYPYYTIRPRFGFAGLWLCFFLMIFLWQIKKINSSNLLQKKQFIKQLLCEMTRRECLDQNIYALHRLFKEYRKFCASE